MDYWRNAFFADNNCMRVMAYRACQNNVPAQLDLMARIWRDVAVVVESDEATCFDGRLCFRESDAPCVIPHRRHAHREAFKEPGTFKLHIPQQNRMALWTAVLEANGRDFAYMYCSSQYAAYDDSDGFLKKRMLEYTSFARITHRICNTRDIHIDSALRTIFAIIDALPYTNKRSVQERLDATVWDSGSRPVEWETAETLLRSYYKDMPITIQAPNTHVIHIDASTMRVYAPYERNRIALIAVFFMVDRNTRPFPDSILRVLYDAITNV